MPASVRELRREFQGVISASYTLFEPSREVGALNHMKVRHRIERVELYGHFGLMKRLVVSSEKATQQRIHHAHMGIARFEIDRASISGFRFRPPPLKHALHSHGVVKHCGTIVER